MGQFWDHIPNDLFPWILQQHLFWVASAPLSEDGHVNVSPKGLEGTFHIVDEHTVWYEDMTGSGVETISHVRENGRITILFVAFEGPPRLIRLFGTGTIYEFGTPEYEELLPPGKQNHASRAVVVIKVHKVGSSCGYSVPFYEFKYNRTRYNNAARTLEAADVAHENECPTDDQFDPSNPPEKGLRAYWKTANAKSLDGLPALLSAPFNRLGPRDDLKPEKATVFDSKRPKANVAPDGQCHGPGRVEKKASWVDVKFLAGLSVGFVLALCMQRVR
ncbi:hypothetical protein K435DRAFT_874235 [Dendrothele bispora CBS 962.96]|uniref:Pyridoxamine 5'-phosphate oxidase N-terminal domain-containing protein n=1 Tax=Dendrothele bispora (strain CBS 962.96) TaxID=1314807 RepID=A0A4S8KX71_DENBC|nr:hypothetical protein K435DRAFT_874235 [Dendrothele bispora CBS 962.96]